MRRHLNTLYVTTPDAWLHKDGENVVVRLEGVELTRIPIHLLGGIVCFGSTGATPALMGHCAARGVCISFADRNGRFLARVEGPVSGNVLLRMGQYRAAEDIERTGSVASHIVTGEVLNQRTVVRRALRDYVSGSTRDWTDGLTACDRRLSDVARRSARLQDADMIRGIEGEAARAYYAVFDDLIRVDEPALAFNGRSRRPPLDPLNALLSFLYTLLLHDCRSALETVGLDPAVGFLHRPRPGRASLALDMMEELRPVIADRLALSLINRRQLTVHDFQSAVSGAVSLGEEGRKTTLVAYQTRKKDEIVHPFLEEKTTMGLVPFVQANLMARHLRGDLDAYPPFLWR